MRRKLLLLKLCSLLVSLGLYTSAFATQLSGGYTINPGSAATATNFQDFSSAITYLTSAATRADGGPSNATPFGVSGPVTFTVAAGTYSGQVIVPVISGTSTSNTVTFEGVNPATRIITASIAGQATVVVNLAKYVVFRNLTITNNALNTPTGIAIVGTNIDNSGTGCKIRKCIINIPNTNISNTSFGILTTATALGAGASNNRIDSVEIDSNTVNGGYYGIDFYGNSGASSSYNRANKVRNNTVSAYYMGIYVYYHYNQMDILYNTVNMFPSANLNYGIYFYYCQNNTSVPSNFIGNKIFNAGYMGAYIANSNNGTANATKIYNNVIAGTFMYSTNYGLYTVTTHKLDVQHNSVDIGSGSAGSTKYAFYFSGATTGNIFKNNNFSITATSGTTTYPAYFSTNPTGNVANYNNYFNAAGINLGYRGAAFTNVVTSYKTTTTGGDSSFNIRPRYTGLTDLHLASACSQPTGVDLTATVPTDIDGLSHSIAPYVGAYEPVLVSNDLTIDAYLYPIAPITVGANDVAVRVRNNGTNTITSFNINYKLNGGAAVTIPWTGTLAACDTVTLVFMGTNQATLGVSNTLKVYTSSPNGVSDGNPVNDTFNTSLYAPLNGAYTVGSSGSFPTIAAVANAISLGGVSGPVTVTVAPGTYTDQVVLNGPIIGVSATNTITFDGVDAATRVIENTLAGASCVLIKEASYVTIKNFTVRNLANSTCTGIALVGNTTNNAGVGFTVKKCIIQLPNVGTATSYGIIVTGNASGTADANQYTDSVTIDSNTIVGGYYGIQISTSGNSNASYNRGHKITNNIINNAYYYGIRAYYLYNAVDILNNKIVMNATNASSYGIYFYYCQNASTVVPSRVNGNDITAGYTALYNYYTNSGTSLQTQIWNNKLVVNGSCYAALYCVNPAAATVSILHNTIVATGSGTYGGMYFSTMTAAGTVIKNNIFSINGGTSAYFGSNPAGSNNVNYNNYYNGSGTALVYRNGASYTVANYKTAANGGDTSYNQQPSFISTTNYNLANGCDPKGVDLTAILPNDIEGNLRSTTPLIGASEYQAVSNDIMIDKVLAPVAPVVSGLQDVVIRVKNTGNNTVTAFNVSYKNNTGAVITLPWTGTLGACDTVSITFTGPNQINLIASNSFIAYTSLPNGLADAKPANDTVRATYLAPLAGTYTIGTGGTYASFLDANNALTIAGISAPVVFNVLPGTYTGQVVLSGPVIGLSATNTLTFDGVNAATRIIQDSANRAAFIVNKVSYVTIKNLTVNNSFAGTCSGIAIVGSTGGNDGVGGTIKNCVVNLPNTGTSTSYGIIVTGNVNGTGDANQYTDSITIDSNTVNGGYYGIQISTSANGNASYNRGHRIRYNTINNPYYYGMRVYYIYNPVDILYNKIVMNPTNVSSYGIYFYYCQNSSTLIPSRVIGNHITAGYTALYNYYTNSGTTNPTQIWNNVMVTNGSCYASLYCVNPAGATVSIAHNTIVATKAGTYGGMYFSTMTAAGSIVKNNIFAINGGTPAYFGTNPAGTNNVNYNNYINGGGSALVYRNGTSYTATNYNTPTVGGDTSFSQDPLFVSATDFHTSNACTKGIDLTSIIPADYDGIARPITPSLGAYEATGYANDISVDKVYYTTPIAAGLQNLTIRVRNNTPNVATSFNVTYKLNGGTAVTLPWTGTLNGCGDTAIVTFTGAQQLNLPAGANTLLVYTSSPNGVADNNTKNDTVNSALTTITKVAGNALIMNGTGGITAGSAIRFTSRPEMIGTTAFTAEAWVKITNPTADQKFVCKSNVSNGFALGVNPTGKFDPEIWTVANGTGSVRITTAGVSLANNVIPANTWTHVAVTWQSGVGVKAYINGELAGYLNSTTSTTMSQSATDLFLGINSWDYGFATTGAIDEVRLWNVALDTTALRRNMHRTLSGNEPGLTTYIQLNEGVGSATFGEVIGGATGFRGAAAVIASSTLPLGGDSTLTNSSVLSGTYYNGDMTLNVYDAFDNACDLTMTEIKNAPNTLPSALTTFTTKYWVVRTFGNPGIFLADMTINMPFGQLNTSDPSLGLYRRGFNSDGAWTYYKPASSIFTTQVVFSGIDTLGQFTIASNGTSPLPVSLLSFGGKRVEDIVKLNWLTASEINSREFEIQRSYTGSEDFETIGSVASIGNNKGTKSSYSYTDKDVYSNSTIYYRLKQIDMDGKYSYSPIVVIDAVAGDDKTTVYPNPFDNQFTVNVHSTGQSAAAIKVVDITGKEVLSGIYAVQAGNSTITVDAVDFKTGLYFISVELNGTKQTVKVNKQ